MLGIDIPIEDLRAEMAAKFASCDVYGRVYRNKRGEQIIPEYYLGNNQYIEVLQNDMKSGVIFFDVEPKRDEQGTIGNATVNICFLLDLQKLYPGEDRPTELAHQEARETIRHSAFEIESLTTGITALEQFSVENIDDMAPYYIFSFQTTVNYSLLNC